MVQKERGGDEIIAVGKGTFQNIELECLDVRHDLGFGMRRGPQIGSQTGSFIQELSLTSWPASGTSAGIAGSKRKNVRAKSIGTRLKP